MLMGTPALGAEALLISRASGAPDFISKRTNFLKYVLILGTLVSGPVIAIEFLINLKPPYIVSLLLLIAFPIGKLFSVIKSEKNKSKSIERVKKSSEGNIRSILKKKGLENLAKEKKEEKDR